jgi:hypothetical protein
MSPRVPLCLFCVFVFVFSLVVFETGCPHAAQADLKLWISCLSLLSAGITGVHHYSQLVFWFLKYVNILAIQNLK